MDILGEKAKKFGFTRLWTGKIQVFQAPTGYSTAEEAFIAFLSDNIFNFEAKEAKKFFFEAQIQRISEVFAPQTGNEGFYCVFK